MLRRLDGEHDRAALISELVRAGLDGQLLVEKAGVAIRDQDGLQSEFGELVDRQLPVLAENALLVG